MASATFLLKTRSAICNCTGTSPKTSLTNWIGVGGVKIARGHGVFDTLRGIPRHDSGPIRSMPADEIRYSGNDGNSPIGILVSFIPASCPGAEFLLNMDFIRNDVVGIGKR